MILPNVKRKLIEIIRMRQNKEERREYARGKQRDRDMALLGRMKRTHAKRW